ncbi:hypothetical protein D6C19_11435 [Ligilactobacillus murinus]|uniref:Uncharacterized protein n=1 Tax=Ligilactobacillus murinus TaxID=1622 RepID=A0A4Q1ZYC7_9LACO|nr:hypothetical protein D6C19_11435 [Ligilactobacillus murinus]
MILPSSYNLCFSALIFSSNTDAGSSFGSCGTSFPCIATSSTFCLSCVANCFNCSCSFSIVLTFEINSLYESTIFVCSFTGGRKII